MLLQAARKTLWTAFFETISTTFRSTRRITKAGNAYATIATKVVRFPEREIAGQGPWGINNSCPAMKMAGDNAVCEFAQDWFRLTAGLVESWGLIACSTMCAGVWGLARGFCGAFGMHGQP